MWPPVPLTIENGRVCEHALAARGWQKAEQGVVGKTCLGIGVGAQGRLAGSVSPRRESKQSLGEEKLDTRSSSIGSGKSRRHRGRSGGSSRSQSTMGSLRRGCSSDEVEPARGFGVGLRCGDSGGPARQQIWASGRKSFVAGGLREGGGFNRAREMAPSLGGDRLPVSTPLLRWMLHGKKRRSFGADATPPVVVVVVGWPSSCQGHRW